MVASPLSALRPLLLSLGLLACGETAVVPETDSDETAEADGASYVLSSEDEPCDGEETMTAGAVRSLLPAPGTYTYAVAYTAGGKATATLVLGAFGTKVECLPKSTTASVAPAVRLVFEGRAELTTDDGKVVGTLDVHALVAGGRSMNGIEVSWGARAEIENLTGTLQPSLQETGYDGHAIVLLPDAPGDQAGGRSGVDALVLSEIVYETELGSQRGADLAMLRRTAD